MRQCGVQWGLRVWNLSPLAPWKGEAVLKVLLSFHSRPALQSRCPGSLLGERSFPFALAAQREESFERSPQKRALWEGWRCVDSRCPKPRTYSLLSAPWRVAGRRGGSGPLSAPLTRARNGSLVSDFFYPRTQKTTFFSTCLASAFLTRTLLATCLAPLFCCGVSDQDLEEPRGGGGREHLGAEQFWGNLNA